MLKLAIDEFSLHKGRRYAAVVIDVENLHVFCICKGKTRKAIQLFSNCCGKKAASTTISQATVT